MKTNLASVVCQMKYSQNVSLAYPGSFLPHLDNQFAREEVWGNHGLT